MKNRKTVKILLALCLTLIIGVFAGVAALANTSATDDGLKIAYKNIDLDSTVRIAFAIEKDAVDAYDSIKLVVTDEVTGDPIALEYVRDASGALTEDLFVNEYEINGVAYYAYFTTGFAPKDFDTVVNAYAVGVKNGEDVAAGPSLRYSVIEYLLRQQDKNLDPTRQELYAAFLEYHEYAAKVLGTYTPTYLVKVNDGSKTVTRTYKEGEKVSVTADTSAIVAGSTEAGFNIGWVDAQGKVVALGANAEFVASATGLVSPCYVFPTSNVKTADDTYVLKIAKDDNNLGSTDDGFDAYAWSDLNDGDSETYVNLRGTALANIGNWSYDATLDAIVMNTGNRASNSNAFAHVSLTNPNNGATDGSNVSVLEFDVTIPSRDYDGDGIYNEANGDFFYAGGVGTAIANIQVGFENNNFALYQATERLFTLTIYANTSKDGNKVTCWALGSTGDIADASNHANIFNSQTNVSKYEHYNLDETYTIKLVYVPGTYSSEDRNVTTDTKTIGKIDIYVNGEYHHSRGFVSSSSVATGKTSDYEDKELGMTNAAVTNTSTPNRFNNSKRIGVALGSSGGSLGGEYYSNFVAYSMPAYAMERTGVHGGTYEVYGISYLTAAEMRNYLSHTVTVNGGSYTYGDATGLTSGKVFNGDTITLTAPATKDGKLFSYWANEFGARIQGSGSKSSSLAVVVTADATYKAVYGADLLSTSGNPTGAGTMDGLNGRNTGHLYLKSNSTTAMLNPGPSSNSMTRPLNSANDTKYPSDNAQIIHTAGAKTVYLSYDYHLLLEDRGTPTDDLKTRQDGDKYYMVTVYANGVAGERYGDLFGSGTNTNTHHGVLSLYDGSAWKTMVYINYLVQSSNNIATGFKIRVCKDGDGNGAVTFDKVLPLGEAVALTFALNVGEDGNVTGIDVYANGELVGTAPATSLANTAWSGSHVRFAHTGQNRFIGRVAFDNFSILSEYHADRVGSVTYTYDAGTTDLPSANRSSNATNLVLDTTDNVLHVTKGTTTGESYLFWAIDDLPELSGDNYFVIDTKIKFGDMIGNNYTGKWALNINLTTSTKGSADNDKIIGAQWNINNDIMKYGSTVFEKDVWYDLSIEYTYNTADAKYHMIVKINGIAVTYATAALPAAWSGNVTGFSIKITNTSRFNDFNLYLDDTTLTWGIPAEAEVE